MVSAAIPVSCTRFPLTQHQEARLGMTHSNTMSANVGLRPLVLPGPSTNVPMGPWAYLHLRASLNTNKGSFGDSRGSEECTEVEGVEN